MGTEKAMITFTRCLCVIAYAVMARLSFVVFRLAEKDNDDRTRWNSRMFIAAANIFHCIISVVWNAWDAATVPYGDLNPSVSTGVSVLLFTLAMSCIVSGTVSRAVYWRQILTTKNLQKLKDVRTTLPWTIFWAGVPTIGGIVAAALTFAEQSTAAIIVGGASLGWGLLCSACGTLWYGHLVQEHLLKSERKDVKSAMFVCNEHIIQSTAVFMALYGGMGGATLAFIHGQSTSFDVNIAQLGGVFVVSCIGVAMMYTWTVVYTTYFNRINQPLHYSDDQPAQKKGPAHARVVAATAGAVAGAASPRKEGAAGGDAAKSGGGVVSTSGHTTIAMITVAETASSHAAGTAAVAGSMPPPPPPLEADVVLDA